jgi:hypothetical protein
MSDPDTAFHPERALDVLARHQVRFVLIGGLAGNVLGSPSATYDLDICYARDDDNLERLAAALVELGARLRGTPENVKFLLDAKTLKAGDHFTFATSAGSLDCLGNPAGTNGYADLMKRATSQELVGHAVLVASLDDLIQMKQAAGRRKDLIEVEILGALRDEIEGRD